MLFYCLISFAIFAGPSYGLSLTGGEIEVSAKKGGTSAFEIDMNAVYFVEVKSSKSDSYNPATFCKLQQPDLDFTENLKTSYNLNENLNQQAFLIIEDKLLILSPNNTLIVFDLEIKDKGVHSMKFWQTFWIKDDCLNTSYVLQKMLYDVNNELLIIVSCNKLHFYYFQLSSNNIFQPIRFYKTIPFNGTINKTLIFNDFVYILLNSTIIDVWRINDYSDKSYNYIDIYEVVGDIAGLRINDFSVNENYVFIVENKTNAAYFLDRYFFNLKTTIHFDAYVQNIRSYGDTLFILYQTLNKTFVLKEYFRLSSSNDFFYENNAFEMNSPVKDMFFLNDKLLVARHENLLTIIEHSIKAPSNVSAIVKRTIAWEGLEHLTPRLAKKRVFIGNATTDKMKFKAFLEEQYFLNNLMVLTNKKEIYILSMNFLKASVICVPNDSLANSKYILDLDIYTRYDTLQYEFNKESIRLILNVYVELFESSNIALAIGLGIGFSIAFIITIIFCVYFYKIKNKYNALVTQFSPKDPENYPESNEDKISSEPHDS